MIARVVAPLLAACAIVACASIDPPAEFVRPDADIDPSLPDGSRTAGCARVLPRTFTSDTPARIYDLPNGTQAICTSVGLDVPAAGPGLVTLCVFGNLDEPSPRTYDVDLDPRDCSHCADVRTNCERSPDAGVAVPCGTEYLPTAGRMRVVRLARDAGADFWLDVGGLVVARVTERDRDAGTFRLAPFDCLFADGLTLQGTLVAATCAPGDASVDCEIIAARR